MRPSRAECASLLEEDKAGRPTRLRRRNIFSDTMTKRLHAIFRGQVQGIGFRYTARSLAQPSHIAGWIKNLSSGDVEIVAEADEELLKDFLRHIEDHLSGYISDKTVDWQSATGEFKGFEIAF